MWDLDNLPTVMYKSIQHRATYDRLLDVSELGREPLRKAALVCRVWQPSSEDGVHHVFSTPEEALVALELVAKTL